ncbi:Zinc finger protein 333, partial [Stegodyphus mimosarum]
MCEKSFSRSSDLNRHKKTHDSGSFECASCSMKFTRADNLRRQELSHLKSFTCQECSQTFTRNSDLLHHVRVEHSVTRTQEKRLSTDPSVSASKRVKTTCVR